MGGVSFEHCCFVAGRYRDGLLSDSWTDVLRCAERTFVSYVPACECGWTGAEHPADEAGYQMARYAYMNGHLAARCLAVG